MSVTQPVDHLVQETNQRRSLRLHKADTTSTSYANTWHCTKKTSSSSCTGAAVVKDNSSVTWDICSKDIQRASRTQSTRSGMPVNDLSSVINQTLRSTRYNLRTLLSSRENVLKSNEQITCGNMISNSRKGSLMPPQQESCRRVTIDNNCFKCQSEEPRVQNVGLREERSRQRRLPYKLLGTTAEDLFIKAHERRSNKNSPKQDSLSAIRKRRTGSTLVQNNACLNTCRSTPASNRTQQMEPTVNILKYESVDNSNPTEYFEIKDDKRLNKFKINELFVQMVPKQCSQIPNTMSHSACDRKKEVEDTKVHMDKLNTGQSMSLEDLCFSFESVGQNNHEKRSQQNNCSENNMQCIVDNFDKIFSLPPNHLHINQTTGSSPNDNQNYITNNTDEGFKETFSPGSSEKQQVNEEEELFEINSSIVENFEENCTPLPLNLSHPGLFIDIQTLLSSYTVTESDENVNSEQGLEHISQCKTAHLVNMVWNRGKRRKRNRTGWPHYKNKRRPK